MALNDVIDIQGLTIFKQETDKRYQKQEAGKGLIETEKVTKLDGIEEQAQKNVLTEIQINGSKIEPEGTVVNLTAADLAADLTDYAKKEELEAFKKSLGTTEKGTTTTEEMATLKDSAQAGEIYKNTDDSHYYQFVGEGADGADANGFIDLGESVELGDFATNAGVKAGLGKKADSATVTGQLAAKADKTELDAYTKTEELAEAEVLTNKFLDKETAASTYLTIEAGGKIGTIRGTCEKSELESKKAEAQNGWCYVVTDDGNHIHYYNGTDFIDCGSHIDLSGYDTSAKVDEKLAKKLDTTAAEETYIKSADVTVADETDIQALFTE